MADRPISEQLKDLTLETGLDVKDDIPSKHDAHVHTVDDYVPNISREPSADFQYKIGDTIHLEGMSGSGPFQWKFNGEMLAIKANSRELTIEFATMTDSGEYECTFGDKTCIYSVNVYDYQFNSFLGIRTTVTDSSAPREFSTAKGLDGIIEENSDQTSRLITDFSYEGNLTQYKMTGSPRGLAVIIAIEDFENLNKLHGIKEDIRMCENTFKRLHFDVQICTKTKARDIIKYLKSIANKNHSEYDCFILYVSSHGGRGYVCCSDFNGNTEVKLATQGEIDRNNTLHKKETDQGYILYDTLLEPFLSFKHCTTLGGKPKLFFFDCCRGDTKEFSSNTNESPIRGFQNEHEKNQHFADILIGYATISGNIARMNKTGSIYTKVLTECLNKYSQQLSLGDIMTQVHGRMMKQFEQPAYIESTLCGRVIMNDLTSD